MTDETTPEPVELAETPPRDDAGRFTAPEPTEPPEAAEEPPAEEAGDSDDEGDLHDAKPRGKNAQARFNELTRLRREAERERDFYKGLATQQAPHSPQDGATVEPDIDDFESYGDYVKALAKHEVRQQQEATATQRTQIIREASWESKVEAARSTIPDYAQVVGSSDIDVSNIADALMESDRGPELAYYLATRPELAERLNRMSPVKAALELGRLETSLAAPAVKVASKAPAPATPLRSSGSVAPPNLGSADFETYRAERRKQGATF